MIKRELVEQLFDAANDFRAQAASISPACGRRSGDLVKALQAMEAELDKPQGQPNTDKALSKALGNLKTLIGHMSSLHLVGQLPGEMLQDLGIAIACIHKTESQSVAENSSNYVPLQGEVLHTYASIDEILDHSTHDIEGYDSKRCTRVDATGRFVHINKKFSLHDNHGVWPIRLIKLKAVADDLEVPDTAAEFDGSGKEVEQ